MLILFRNGDKNRVCWEGWYKECSLSLSHHRPQDSVPPPDAHLEGLRGRGTSLSTEGSVGKHFWGAQQEVGLGPPPFLPSNP